MASKKQAGVVGVEKKVAKKPPAKKPVKKAGEVPSETVEMATEHPVLNPKVLSLLSTILAKEQVQQAETFLGLAGDDLVKFRAAALDTMASIIDTNKEVKEAAILVRSVLGRLNVVLESQVDSYNGKPVGQKVHEMLAEVIKLGSKKARNDLRSKMMNHKQQDARRKAEAIQAAPPAPGQQSDQVVVAPPAPQPVVMPAQQPAHPKQRRDKQRLTHTMAEKLAAKGLVPSEEAKPETPAQ